jgi:restriction endonuclease Mrr
MTNEQLADLPVETLEQLLKETKPQTHESHESHESHRDNETVPMMGLKDIENMSDEELAELPTEILHQLLAQNGR